MWSISFSCNHCFNNRSIVDVSPDGACHFLSNHVGQNSHLAAYHRNHVGQTSHLVTPPTSCSRPPTSLLITATTWAKTPASLLITATTWAKTPTPLHNSSITLIAQQHSS